MYALACMQHEYAILHVFRRWLSQFSFGIELLYGRKHKLDVENLQTL